MPDSESSGEFSSAQDEASVGEMLRGARKQRGLSLEQLAENLHFDEQILAALENDDFGRLGAPVFVRGHLKICARQLELDPDAILQAYDSQHVELSDSPSLEGPTRLAPVTINLLPWVTGLVGIGLGIGLLVYLLQGEDSTSMGVADMSPGFAAEFPEDAAGMVDSPAEQRLADPPQPELAASTAQAVSDPVPAIRPAENDAAPRAAPAPAPVEPVAADEASARLNEKQRLSLSFRGEAWVEISDREKRLLFGLQRAGARRELVGEPPFKLVLGNSQVVELYLNDEPYDLPAGSTRGKVARFSIDPR